MTRMELEGKLVDKLHEIQDLVNQYSETDFILSMSVKPGYVSAFRPVRDFDEITNPSDDDYDINFFKFV